MEKEDKSAPPDVRKPPQDAFVGRRENCPAALHFIRIPLQGAALAPVSVQSCDTARLLHPRSLLSAPNNKLKAVKFPRCN